MSRAAEALRDFGAPEVVVEALLTARPDEIVWTGSPPARIDVLQSIPGVEFEGAFGRRLETTWAGMNVPVLGREDLIAAKRAAGRPQDLRDARALERAAKR